MADSHSAFYLSMSILFLLGDKTPTPKWIVMKLFRNESRVKEILRFGSTASCGKLSVLHANAYVVQ